MAGRQKDLRRVACAEFWSDAPPRDCFNATLSHTILHSTVKQKVVLLVPSTVTTSIHLGYRYQELHPLCRLPKQLG
jgi:hypothetical protein